MRAAVKTNYLISVHDGKIYNCRFSTTAQLDIDALFNSAKENYNFGSRKIDDDNGDITHISAKNGNVTLFTSSFYRGNVFSHNSVSITITQNNGDKVVSVTISSPT